MDTITNYFLWIIKKLARKALEYSMVKGIFKTIYFELLRFKWLRSCAWTFAYMGEFTEWKQQHPCKEFKGRGWDETRRELWEYVAKKSCLDKPFNYLEFGVYKGDSIRWWTEINTHPDSRFVGFDSFEGLPEHWKSNRPEGYFTTSGKIPNIQDKRCSFQIGLFNDTLPNFVEKFSFDNMLVVHLDADLYTSTLFVLFSLAPKLKKGDILIFDEFLSPSHEFRAFTDFVSAYNLKYELLAKTSNYRQIALRIE